MPSYLNILLNFYLGLSRAALIGSTTCIQLSNLQLLRHSRGIDEVEGHLGIVLNMVRMKEIMWEKQAVEVASCAKTFMFRMYATAANIKYISE